MRIWHYHPDNGPLLGEGLADPCQVEEGKWLIPAYATTIAPPAASAGRIPVFDGAQWFTIPDHRGETWWLAGAIDNTQPVVVNFLGDPAAKGLTATEPPAPIPPPTAPKVATADQIRMALEAAGKTPEQIEALFELAKAL